MSARREHRLRKLEANVADMEGRVGMLEHRLMWMEDREAHRAMILSTGEDTPRRRGVLASLLLWLKGRKDTD